MLAGWRGGPLVGEGLGPAARVASAPRQGRAPMADPDAGGPWASDATQVKAEIPVRSLPRIRVWTSSVPS